MLGITIAFIAGCAVGAITMCCCVAAGRADRALEEEVNSKADIT